MSAGVLIVCGGESDGTEYAIDSEETILGRNPTTDVTLVDESISREHALVSYDPDSGDFTIEDLQSTNGTKVNGKRARSSPLAHGDEISVGHTKLRFENR